MAGEKRVEGSLQREATCTNNLIFSLISLPLICKPVRIDRLVLKGDTIPFITRIDKIIRPIISFKYNRYALALSYKSLVVYPTIFSKTDVFLVSSKTNA